MLNYLTRNPIVAVIFIVIVIAVAIFLFVKVMQRIGIKKIRKYVYQLFEEAEEKFKHGENTLKFEYVINLARSAIPSPFDIFINETFIKKVVQLWFNIWKDLLDDGKLNGNKEE